MSAIVSGRAAGDRLVLEITETVLLRDDRLTKDALHHLRQLGVKIALDDFGTGHSSLHYLQKFQFDKFKIDRSFIATFERTAPSAVVRAVINMGRDLGVSVIAEGVETKRQFEGLKALGCQSAQGFFFGEPRASTIGSRRGFGEARSQGWQAAKDALPDGLREAKGQTLSAALRRAS